MSKYGARNKYDIYGLDFNEEMITITNKKLKSKKIVAELVQGNVEKMPYGDHTFDTIINTMAFTGYPNGDRALSELKRVLKPGENY